MKKRFPSPSFASLDANPALGHAAATSATPPPPTAATLPPTLDADIFDPDQLDYLADFYQGEMLRCLRQFYALLRAVPPGEEPTPRTVGINAAILAKFFALEEPLLAIRWSDCPRILHVKKDDFWAQFRAIRLAFREIHPRSSRALDIYLVSGKNTRKDLRHD